jgi:hypothetical protein
MVASGAPGNSPSSSPGGCPTSPPDEAVAIWAVTELPHLRAGQTLPMLLAPEGPNGPDLSTLRRIVLLDPGRRRPGSTSSSSARRGPRSTPPRCPRSCRPTTSARPTRADVSVAQRTLDIADDARVERTALLLAGILGILWPP